jgi:hypothetical protein
LDDPERVEESIDSVYLHPPDELLGAMTPRQRVALHRILRRSPENQFHHSPLVIPHPDAKTWLQSKGFPQDVAEQIAKLSYEFEGRKILTADQFALKQVESLQGRAKLYRLLCHEHGLIVRLRIRPDSDLRAIADYWRDGNKQETILPVLEAVARTQGVEYLDIAHLLPPTARKLLNTFPELRSMRAGNMPDCLWTAANFFRVEASDRMLNPVAAARELMSLYEPVDGERRFGDLIMLIPDENPIPVHAAIYIADDIVFTKNGYSMFKPWVLMRIDRMMQVFSRPEAMHAEWFRRTAHR